MENGIKTMETLAGVTYRPTKHQGVWVSKGGSVAVETLGGGLSVLVAESVGFHGELANQVWLGNLYGSDLELTPNRELELNLPNGTQTTVGELLDQIDWEYAEALESAESETTNQEVSE